MNDFIELSRIWAVVVKRWWVILLITLLIGGIGYLFSLIQTPIYAATTTLAVDKLVVANALKYTDIEAISQLMRNYADIGIRQPVLEPVTQVLGLEESWQLLQNRVRVTPLAYSQLLEITVEATSGEEAVRIADEVARQLLLLNLANTQQSERNAQTTFAQERLDSLRLQIEQGQQQIDTLRTIQASTVLTNAGVIVGDLWVNPATNAVTSSISQVQKIGEEIEKLQRMIIEWERSYDRWKVVLQENESFKSLTVIEPAQASLTPVRPRTQVNVIIFSSIGLVLSLGLIGLLEQLDDRIKPSKEIMERLGAPILGVIRRRKVNRLKSWLFPEKMSAPFVLEDYRALHNKIEMRCIKTPKTILVTSPNAKEGRSTIVANLGVAIAHAGYNVIIVDADWRSPIQHELFQIPNNKGLRQALIDTATEFNIPLWSMDQAPNLKVLTSGIPSTQYDALMADAVFPGSLEQWRSVRMRQLLTHLMAHADIVLVDSPPLLAFADAAALAHQADGVILVLDTDQTKWNAAKEAISTLKQVQANLLGIVFNHTGAKRKPTPLAQSSRQLMLHPTSYPIIPNGLTPLAVLGASAHGEEPANKPASKNVSKNGLPHTGFDTRLILSPDFPNAKALPQDRNGIGKVERGVGKQESVTFEQLGVETVTLAGPVKVANVPLTSAYGWAAHEGDQVQLEIIVWLNEKPFAAPQTLPIDFLEIAFNHVSLQRILLEKDGPQTFSFAIPALPQTVAKDAHHLLQISLHGGNKPEADPNTVVVIRATSRVISLYHHPFETVN